MANLIQWIEAEAGGKTIEAVVIGEMGWGDYGKGSVPNYKVMPRNKVISWKEAKPFLDYTFDDGYGAPGCNAITAWTEDKVIAISQYDGSTSVFSLPRNPVDHMPDMPGG